LLHYTPELIFIKFSNASGYAMRRILASCNKRWTKKLGCFRTNYLALQAAKSGSVMHKRNVVVSGTEDNVGCWRHANLFD